MAESETEKKASEERLDEKAEEAIVKIEEREIKRKSFEEKRKEELKTKIASWVPKTKLGKKVKSGEIKEIDYILDNNLKILESEIVDSLLEVKSDLILIGQSKGKFGGGKRRAWRQTQRKTKEGNIPTFSALAIVGDEKEKQKKLFLQETKQ